MRNVEVLPLIVLATAFQTLAAVAADPGNVVPGVLEMMEAAPASEPQSRPVPETVGERKTGFTVRPGWPLYYSGSTVDGGMLVDMDGDPELELVQVTQSTVHALNSDGSEVPGWPQVVGNNTFAAPAFGDIDGDGEGEVVLHSFFFGIGGSLFALNRDGTTVPGFPLSLGGTVKGPALGNLDANADLEILSVQNQSGIGHLYAIDGNGSTLPGWPQAFDHVGGSGPAVGDLDGDLDPEIVAVSYVSLYVFDPAGNLLPGFPFTPGGGQTFNYNTPVLADLDRDGDREIIVCTSPEAGGGGRAYVLHHDGTVAAGWPRNTNYAHYIPASVVDLDGDGWLDILTADQVLSPSPVNSVYGWDRSGNNLPGFPIRPIEAVFAQIIVADLDGDGMLELSFDSNVGGSDIQGYNHDGTPMAGWPLFVDGSSFQQSLNVGDLDGNGLIDLAGAGNLVGGQQEVSLYLWSADFPWVPDDAPLPTYQYNVRRDGVVESGGASGVAGSPARPTLTLHVGPNPLTTSATIRLEGWAEGRWQVEIYDLAGRRVRNLGAGAGAPAILQWGGQNDAGRALPNGVYLIRASQGAESRTLRTLLLR